MSSASNTITTSPQVKRKQTVRRNQAPIWAHKYCVHKDGRIFCNIGDCYHQN